jgi:hypothetical protein
MKVAVTQPNYLPWLGYFALLDEVDLWISSDNCQRLYSSFIVRNRVKTHADQVKWLTVGLKGDAPVETLIRDCLLAPSDWAVQHINRIKHYYLQAAHYREFFPLIRDLITPRNDEPHLGRYNRRVVQELCGLLGISIEIVDSSSLCGPLNGDAQENFIQLAKLVGATEVYNFSRGVEVCGYSGAAFREHGMRLFRQEYEHPVYRQTGRTFVSHLSMVDLLLNEGSAARDIIRSGSRWSEVN